MRYSLRKGMKSLNGQVEIIDIDKLSLVVNNISRSATGIRTVSKELVNEFVEYFEKHPNNSAQEAREALAGRTQIDKFEYGYCSTLTILAKMILGDELSAQDKKLVTKTSTNDSDKPLQVIYYGAPGTGKSYKIDEQTSEKNSVRITFHPDSDYASFVGAYKPTMEDVPISAIVGKEVHEAVPQGKHTGKEKKIVYKYVPQAFLKAYVEAWRRYADGMNYNKPVDIPYYLIIEEINRGNCAQIFGDLFQLLDRNNMGASSYPIQADEDIARFLKEDENGFSGFSDDQRRILSNFTLEKDNGDEREIGEDIINGKLLLLPPNLRIWATMNTSDQSLFPIDSAFKRRWDWEYMPIKYDVKDWTFQIGESLYSWGDFLRKINPEIYALTESADKQMGYFFVKANKQTRIIPENMFLNKVLFYLWTEVFKDFDISSEIFKNKKENRSFRFTDFFEDEEALSIFIDNLGLEPITVEDEKEAEDKDWEDKDDEGNEEEKERTLTPTTETQKWYQEIWTKTRNKYLEQGCDFNVAPNVKNWFEKRLGTGGIVLENKINRKEGSSCVGIYLYKNAANKYYSKLLAYKQDIEKDLPFELKWEGPTEKRGCASIRVIEAGFNFKDLEDQERAIDWMVTRGIQIEKAFKPYIDKLK